MILTGNDLRKFMSEYVSNSTYANIETDSPNSINLSLSGKFLVEDMDVNSALAVIDIPSGTYMKQVEVSGNVMLAPFSSTYVTTNEIVSMPDDHYGVVTLRSRYARNGLDHATSIYIQPGWSGNIVLELRNMNKTHSFILSPNENVVQMHVFEK